MYVTELQVDSTMLDYCKFYYLVIIHFTEILVTKNAFLKTIDFQIIIKEPSKNCIELIIIAHLEISGKTLENEQCECAQWLNQKCSPHHI